MGRCLAAIFAHPDDESLFAGGLLAWAAREGARVQLLSLTRGEGGWSRFGERGGALAVRRQQELRAACEALGVQPPEIWAWPDGGLAELEPAMASLEIAAWLRAQAPQVVVTFGLDGAYGHVDHVICARLVRAAVEALVTRAPGPEQGDAPSTATARLLETAFPRKTFARARARLERFVDARILPVPAAALGTEAHAEGLCLSLDDELARRKRAAVAAHASQLPQGDANRLLAPGLLDALSRREHYRIVRGAPLPRAGASDPFEGLP